MKTVNALEIFTHQMIRDAKKCRTVDEIELKVIKPNLKMIDDKTGQENNSKYWAYAMQHVLNQIRRD